MAASLSEVVGQFKAEVGKILSAALIKQLFQSLEHVWRERVLNPATTVQVFLLQVLNGNIACTALPRLADLSFTATVYCAARMRLPLKLFEKLLERVVAASFLDIDEATSRWRGHRTWLIDGSSFSMPNTPPLQAHFGQPGAQAPGCDFPVAHLLSLFHAGTCGFLDGNKNGAY